jgi:hypothetical protein
MSKQLPPHGERVEKVEIFAGALPRATGMVAWAATGRSTSR